jgi:hypothetical protein
MVGSNPQAEGNILRFLSVITSNKITQQLSNRERYPDNINIYLKKRYSAVWELIFIYFQERIKTLLSTIFFLKQPLKKTGRKKTCGKL